VTLMVETTQPSLDHRPATRNRGPTALKVYRFTRRLFDAVQNAASAAFSGFWLGLLDRRALHLLDEVHYNGQKPYWTVEYNRHGLWDWEATAVDRYFSGCKCVLVAAAGGGREVLALSRRGLEVDAFECHPGLAGFANSLLASEGSRASVCIAPRDGCPDLVRVYDGVIVGWGAYTLIMGRSRRVAFLQQLRALSRPQAPILVSYWARVGREHALGLTARTANAIRRLMRKERCEIGDSLAPSFGHFFTDEEIVAELRDGGYDVVFESREPYGHVVGVAR
jgi:hypothetical protein